MRPKRSIEKRLVRKERAKAVERSYQRLRLAMSGAAVFTSAAVAAILPLQVFGLPAPVTPSSGPLQQPLLMHYALVLALIPTGFLGATFAFRCLSRPAVIATSRLLLLGALFAVASHTMFIPAATLMGILGAVTSLAVLAISIAFLGDRLLSSGRL